MKDLMKKYKILIAIVVIILVAGLVMAIYKGFNFELKYRETQAIEVNLEKSFENSDIKAITDEVLEGQPVIIQKVEEFEDTVLITSTQITDEQKENLITKLNEKYELEISNDDVEIINNAHTKGFDIVKPYVEIISIATICVLVYMAIRFKKIGVIAVVLEELLSLIIAEAVLASIICIARIPVGRLTMPLVLLVYVLVISISNVAFEKKLENKKKELAKQKK